jgi:hypothetical protein
VAPSLWLKVFPSKQTTANRCLLRSALLHSAHESATVPESDIQDDILSVSCSKLAKASAYELLDDSFVTAGKM